MTKFILTAVLLAGFAFNGMAQAAEKSEVQKLFDKYTPLREAKKFDEAVKVLDEVIKLAPDNPYPWSEGAWMLNEQKRYDVAVKAAEKSIEVKATHSHGWRELGYALMKQAGCRKGQGNRRGRRQEGGHAKQDDRLSWSTRRRWTAASLHLPCDIPAHTHGPCGPGSPHTHVTPTHGPCGPGSPHTHATHPRHTHPRPLRAGFARFGGDA